jgi:uncharacterized membrane protein
MSETLSVAFWWVAFGGGHLVLSHGAIREGLRRRLGSNGFNGLYSLLALPAFYFLVMSYFPHRHAGPALWDLRTWAPGVHLVEAMMLLSFYLMVGSFFTPSPLAMDPRGRHEPRGLLRITRHPFTMGAALLGVSHCILNGYGSDLAFFGGLAAFSVAGAFHQDARKRREAGPEQQPFFEQTSVLPFAAILRGIQPLRLGELPRLAAIVAIAAALLVRWYHTRWFGIPLA